MGRPRKENVAVETKSSNDNNLVEELRQKILELTEKLNSLSSSSQTETVSKPKSDYDDQLDDFDTIKINQDDYIKIISLTPHTLNLSTKPQGKGDLFVFRKFGEVQRILYSDLVKIMQSHKEFTDFLREGYYYIADKRVIRRHGLDDLYEKILTKEKIDKIIECDPKEALTLFQSANKTQQQFVCDILIRKIVNGEKIDLNVIDGFTRISGIEIQKTAEEAKAYADVK